MAKRKLSDRLITRNSIKEELKLIEESNVDYITPSGKVYCDYGNGMMLPKTNFLIKGYLYVSIKSKNGKQVQRRVHILVAKAFIPNPNNYPIVMHKDDNKANPNVDNLQWGTVSQNTKSAFEHHLIKNAKGSEDSQSFPVIQLDLEQNKINTYGSVSIAAKATGITKSGILYQCKHKVKNKLTKPKCGYYFRFLDEYVNSGFVL